MREKLEVAAVIGVLFILPAIYSTSEEAAAAVAFTAIGGGFLYLLVRIAIAFTRNRQERQNFSDAMEARPLHTIAMVVLILSTTAFFCGLAFAAFGYEPEIGDTGWRIWTVAALTATASWVMTIFAKD